MFINCENDFEKDYHDVLELYHKEIHKNCSLTQKVSRLESEINSLHHKLDEILEGWKPK